MYRGEGKKTNSNVSAKWQQPVENNDIQPEREEGGEEAAWLPFNVATSCDVNANGNGSQTNMATRQTLEAEADRQSDSNNNKTFNAF